jgi:chromosome segregation ATPase
MPQEENESGGGAFGEPGAGSRRRDVDLVKNAFSSLQGSKETILERIKGMRAELEDSLRARLKLEADLKDANRELAESRERVRELEAELSSLKGELGTAKTMLDEIDKSIH